jgi:hypothetical protein
VFFFQEKYPCGYIPVRDAYDACGHARGSTRFDGSSVWHGPTHPVCLPASHPKSELTSNVYTPWAHADSKCRAPPPEPPPRSRVCAHPPRLARAFPARPSRVPNPPAAALSRGHFRRFRPSLGRAARRQCCLAGAGAVTRRCILCRRRAHAGIHALRRPRAGVGFNTWKRGIGKARTSSSRDELPRRGEEMSARCRILVHRVTLGQYSL